MWSEIAGFCVALQHITCCGTITAGSFADSAEMDLISWCLRDPTISKWNSIREDATKGTAQECGDLCSATDEVCCGIVRVTRCPLVRYVLWPPQTGGGAVCVPGSHLDGCCSCRFKNLPTYIHTHAANSIRNQSHGPDCIMLSLCLLALSVGSARIGSSTRRTAMCARCCS